MRKQQKFTKAAMAAIAALGATVTRNDENYFKADIQTKFGILRITHFKNETGKLFSIYTCFDNTSQAKLHTDCNGYSGKWNFHNSDADYCLLSFNKLVRQILQPVEKLSELKEGEVVSITSSQFDVTNLCRLVCFDTTGLDRDIAYFQFAGRGYTPATKETVRASFDGGKPINGLFAFWGQNLKFDTITKTAHT